MILRRYRPSDIEDITALFFRSVREGTAGEYTEEQRCAWAPTLPDAARWDREFRARCTAVAEEKGMIVGFGDIVTDGESAGYLDRLYVHAEHLREGIGTALCDFLESSAEGPITVRASLTAQPFFTRRGYAVLSAVTVRRRGIPLRCFLMEKNR